MSKDLGELEVQLGHQFVDRSFLVRALTHKSRVYDLQSASVSVQDDNEQLEFLGDSILGFLASDLLFTRRPNLPEGDLSKLKAHLVSASRLHAVAQQLGVGEFLVLGRGEELSGGRSKRGLLANSVEAILAAIYLDAGLEACRHFVEQKVLADLDLAELERAPMNVDAKSALQEFAQAQGMVAPRYNVLRERGPEHAKTFTVEVRVGSGHAAQADGFSKKDAAQRAARKLLLELSDAETGAV